MTEASDETKTSEKGTIVLLLIGQDSNKRVLLIDQTQALLILSQMNHKISLLPRTYFIKIVIRIMPVFIHASCFPFNGHAHIIV